MKNILFLLVFFYGQAIQAQIFQQTFDDFSALYDIVPLPDGNYVVVGTKGPTAEQAKVWLAKFSASGELLFEKTYLPAGVSALGVSVAQASDQGFFVAGTYSDGSFNGGGGFVLKTLPQGSLAWVKTFTGSYLYSVAPAANGQWLAGGHEDSSEDATVFLLTTTGGIVWQKNYPNWLFRGHIKRILPQADGSFLAVGRGEVTGAGFEGIFVVKADAGGNQLWQREWDSGNYDQELDFLVLGPVGAVQADNGDLIVADASGGKALLLRYTPDGEKIWEKYYGSSEDYTSLFALAQDAQGNLFLAGRRRHVAPGIYENYYNHVIKTTPNGAELWSHTYPDDHSNVLLGVAGRADGSCMVAGRQMDFGNQKAYLAGFDQNGYLYERAVRVRLQRDQDGDCIASSSDAPLPAWNITLQQDTQSYYLVSNDDGEATIPLPDGDYTVSAYPPSTFWQPCDGPIQVTIGAGSPAVSEVNLSMHPQVLCPEVHVSMTSPDLVACNTSIFYVEYSNKGSANASGLKAHLQLDPALTLESCSLPYTGTSGNYAVELPDLPPLGAQRFSFRAKLSCNVNPGQTHCAAVRITPVAPCALAPGPGWTGAHLEVKAGCVNGHAQFTVVNTGNGSSAESAYRVIADGWLRESGMVPALAAGESWSFDSPDGGRSVRFEAAQAAGHPGGDRPIATLEGCGATLNGFPSTGFADMFAHNDRDPQVAVVCIENTPYPLPDRMVSLPEGYGWYHFLPFDAQPKYALKFNNPLSVPAQNVRVRLRLSPLLDAASFSVTAASHPYKVTQEGHVLDIFFDNMQLPATSQDSISGRGYLSFSANFSPAAQDTGMRIINEAQVYFDDAGFSQPVAVYNFTAPEGLWLTDTPSPYSDNASMNLFGLSWFDFAHDVVENPDGSLFMLITTLYAFGVDYDLLLVKTTADGRGIWQKVYDFFGGGDVFYHAQSDGEGGIILSGYQNDPEIPNNYLNDNYLTIARIDKDGNLLWYKREKPGLQGEGANPTGLIRADDGNFVITGYIVNGGSAIDNFLWKITPEGQTVWFKNYLINGVAFYPTGVKQTADGGFLMAGRDENVWPPDFYIQKTDATGETQWTESYNIDQIDDLYNATDFCLNPDGGFTAFSSRGDYDANNNFKYFLLLVRFDSQGNIIWQTTSEVGESVYPGSILPNGKGGYFLCGEVVPSMSSSFAEMLVAEADSAGHVQWWKSYHAQTQTSGAKMRRHSNGNYLMMGQTQTNNYLYNLQAVLLVVTPDGTLSTPALPGTTGNRLLVNPNPAVSRFQVSAAGSVQGPVRWQLFDAQGKVVQEGIEPGFPFQVELGTRSFGVHQLAVQWRGGNAVRPVVLLGR